MTQAPPNAPDGVRHLEAECAVLGAALLTGDAARGAVAQLEPAAFDRHAHQLVFAAIVALVAAGEPIDTVTVGQQLATRGQLDEVGGPVALHDLTTTCPSPTNWRSYAAMVQRAATARRDRAAYLDALNRLGAGDDPAQVRAALPASDPSLRDDLFAPIHWPTAWHAAVEEPTWIVPQLLQAGRSASLVGSAKSGKSLLMLEIAAAVATGGTALGQKLTPRGVLYVDLENALEDITGRLHALGYGPDSDLDRLTYLSFPPLPPLDTEAGGAALTVLARQHHAELVIIDTLSRVIEGDENESRTVLDLYRHTMVPLRRDGIAVVRLDHLGKDPTRGARGSSAKVDDVDVSWQLTVRGSELVEVRRTHARALGYPETLLLHRRTGPLRHVVATGPATHVTADVADVARRLDELGLPPDAGKPSCRTALSEAGDRVANRLLEAAIRYRKGLADLPADLPADPPAAGSSQPTLTGSTGRGGQ